MFTPFYLYNNNIDIVPLTVFSFLIFIFNAIHDPSFVLSTYLVEKLIQASSHVTMNDSLDYPLSPSKSIMSIWYYIHVLESHIIPPVNTICSHIMLLPLKHYGVYSIHEEYNNKYI